jgi:UDP-N-acetylglucosamine 2-epimerase (non-hydrolysing)
LTGTGPRVVSVVGTRPNFVKMAPVIAELRRRLPSENHVLIHTGQHYDRLLSDIFLEELGVPEPDYLLDVGSASHAVQTARVMERIEPVLTELQPDVVLVPGDVNSTLAAALVTSKLHLPVAHVESGLRSFDRSMPEEVNRVLTDHLAELLFVHCQDAADNLSAEGICAGKIRFVGNTMIDSLVAVEDRFRELHVARGLGLEQGNYVLVTLHRPALVDGPLLREVLRRLEQLAREIPVLLPAHPRTRKMLGGYEPPRGLILTEPVGYLEFLSLQADAAAVLTDSGGVQEETTYLGVRCFTLRSTTERPVTISEGTNTLLGLEPDRIAEIPDLLRGAETVRPSPPALWDGHAATRLVDVLLREPPQTGAAGGGGTADRSTGEIARDSAAESGARSAAKAGSIPLPRVQSHADGAAAGARSAEAFDETHYLLERYTDRQRSAKLRTFYSVKPLIPRRLQIALRRAYAPRQARATFPAWPVEPLLVEHRRAELAARVAASAPAPVALIADWPEARPFAAVLTHDVEGTRGVENIMALIEVEQRHGLVSSWNFVAEDYPIPHDLFDRLRNLGCEVALHGIRHDGRLFSSEAAFEAELPAIHRYLSEWSAVGFRSPATHRNADWMPRLGCLYDSSFPDTDPFEPQPGGCCSVFPFFLKDLVELPITLVQDHTLWEILRNESIDLWRTKSDWIIRHGGLINIIVHPDYALSASRLALYDEFCAYLRAELNERDGWHALPREVAMWWRNRDQLLLRPGENARIDDGGACSLTRRARVMLATAAEDDRIELQPQPSLISAA